MPTLLKGSMKMQAPKQVANKLRNDLENKPTTRGFVLISYDISDNKRRLGVKKALEDYGKRVQYSVFECNLTPRQVAALQKRLQPYVKDKTDSIRFYFLSADDLARLVILGAGNVTRDSIFYME